MRVIKESKPFLHSFTNFSAEHATDEKVIHGLRVLETQGTRSIVSHAVTLELARGPAPAVEHLPAEERHLFGTLVFHSSLDPNNAVCLRNNAEYVELTE
jgi:hypothetical protein